MTTNYIEFIDGARKYYLCNMKANVLSNITYVARRGETAEEGAVQRILNRRRIGKISTFLLNGGYFPNNIILNIPNRENVLIDEETSQITITDDSQIAQIIDGQHRVAGIKEAIRMDATICDKGFPVLIGVGLSTADCAQLFVSINNEQQQVPKTLIYDLYGLLDIPNRDYDIDRGHDIAELMNKDENSPYQGYIKFPNSTRFKGGIQLSAFINKIKPLVKRDGEFQRCGLTALEQQEKVLCNYFNALKYYYGQTWFTTKNPFLYTAGLSAAIDVLINKLLPICIRSNNYSLELFKNKFNFTRDTLIFQSSIKGMSGEAGKNHIYQELLGYLQIEEFDNNDIIL